MTRKKIRKPVNPEASRLTKLWRAARVGEFEERHRLLKALLSYKEPEEFVRAWLRLTDDGSHEAVSAALQKAQHDEQQAKARKDMWQKSVVQSAPKAAQGQQPTALPSGKMVAVSGGLPSLGKGSR